jgi:dihydrofolate synthase/folylpolyglutamate synthase
MTYDEALAFIHGIKRFGSKPGLRRVRMLLEKMGNPQEKLRFIHVAGTNGKGSTCAMLSRILTQAGYCTGLYISPYVVDFRERMQVDNESITREELVEIVAYAKPLWEELDAAGETPTEFELVVAIAFAFFLRRNCDVVVLEVGMGGTQDSTNIIGAPLVSVITSISFDHMKYLGNTIREIAGEKCGIIKRGGVTVCYPGQAPEALAVVMERCAEEENKLLIPGNVEIRRMGEDGSDIVWEDLPIHIPLAGEHQIRNAQTVLETCRALELTSLEVTREHIAAGIASTRFPARIERFEGSPLIILDGAHNPAKIAALAKTLEMLGDRRIHLVMAMLRDKDADTCLQELLPRCASLTTTTIPHQPKAALSAAELAEKARPYHTDITAEDDPAKAFALGLSRCEKEDVLLVTGSFYIMSEIRPLALAREEGRTP